jgi:gliding motility-associated-like protein
MLMMGYLMKSSLSFLSVLLFYSSFAQTQVCPLNSNFSLANLTHWFAYTGNNAEGDSPSDILRTYDSTKVPPNGTMGATQIQEYNLPSVDGIRVITVASTDPLGGFSTIPNLNGYVYHYSLLLGSTSVNTSASFSGIKGGYVRGISYRINVPVGPPGAPPYTMTYAYALVLENGTHNSNQQPLFSATLTTNDSIINCASPKYFLPTDNLAIPGETGAIMDTAEAIREGFSLSAQLSPNPNPNSDDPNAAHLRDVWIKGWTEVTFDLTPYRGQQVVLNFEADNCVPGGHFAYAYIAIRNNCSGLIISGDTLACTNSNLVYSVPALTGATYQWTIPPGWNVSSGTDTSSIHVNVGTAGGVLIAHEINSCANLQDTIVVATVPPTIPGIVSSDTTVCAGFNTKRLLLSGNQGNVIGWISSTNGIEWNSLPDNNPEYTATNLSATTTFEALVQNTNACYVDTSTAATVTVDQKSVGGELGPNTANICLDQNTGLILTLTGFTGQITNWQNSQDAINWFGLVPSYSDSVYQVSGLTNSTQYRAIVKNGVCIPDTSSIAYVKFVNVPFPQSSMDPADTTICYGAAAPLNAVITIGTSYAWSIDSFLVNSGDGNITSTPFAISSVASPLTTTAYVLNIQNAGCPNPLLDTFLVNVRAPIIVDAGGDTSVVVDEPLQFHASSNDSAGISFSWSPGTDLNNPYIFNPIAILGNNIDTIRYVVKATDSNGCYGLASVLVRVFKTAPDIFVPNAFTPGKGFNNVFRPIPVGVTSIQYFRIYSRWGQLVYNTSVIGQGWDGMINGQPQGTDSYVWMVKGTDYTGRIITKKGTMTLIR